jgi:hypothetical protein
MIESRNYFHIPTDLIQQPPATCNQSSTLLNAKSHGVIRKALSWSTEEQSIFMREHGKLGNKWRQISDVIGRRSENQVKNYYYSTLRKTVNQIAYQFHLQKTLDTSTQQEGVLVHDNEIEERLYKSQIRSPS